MIDGSIDDERDEGLRRVSVSVSVRGGDGGTDGRAERGGSVLERTQPSSPGSGRRQVESILTQYYYSYDSRD